MLRLLIPFVCLFLSVSVTAETVYKKTNPDGSVEFTDQQSSDTEEIKIRKPSSFSPPRLPRLNLPSKKLSPKFNYSLSILQPANDAVIVNQRSFNVSVSLSPALKIGYGHKLRFQLAGQSKVSANLSATFNNIDRGTHSLNVSVINSQGEAVSSIASATIHIKNFFKKPVKVQK
ncbi:MAG: DUF4124 domain-containing protein [Woeseiaceae bacterium]